MAKFELGARMRVFAVVLALTAVIFLHGSDGRPVPGTAGDGESVSQPFSYHK